MRDGVTLGVNPESSLNMYKYFFTDHEYVTDLLISQGIYQIMVEMILQQQ